MNISIFNLYTIGIGPSSSHTIGPMRAAKFFLDKLKKHKIFDRAKRISVELYGSLASTGIGHGTDTAILAGLEGNSPETVDTAIIEPLANKVKKENSINIYGQRKIDFSYDKDIILKPQETLPYHPNGMLFTAHDSSKKRLYIKTFYSIGGGFIVGSKTGRDNTLIKEKIKLPYPFKTATEMLEMSKKSSLSISSMVMENEKSWRSEDEVYSRLSDIWNAMKESVKNGCMASGILKGGLKLKRRARKIYRELEQKPLEKCTDHLAVLDWVNLWALSVNEENAAGGRIVTAPTNGAAGILPAVLHYYERFCNEKVSDGNSKFLLTAGAIGILYKLNASISGAEVGCQGEVGVACSMAAAGLCEALGGTPAQVENAAEVGMEHNLGLTCDPVGGLVQVPCIERNAMGAVKAINAARIALLGHGRHLVSLDEVMATMKQTGKDMNFKYKETSKGGLAVNITEC